MVHFTFTYTSTPATGRTACTQPQCLYNGALYLYIYLYSPYRPYGLYRASVPVQWCTLPLTFTTELTAALILLLSTGSTNLFIRGFVHAQKWSLIVTDWRMEKRLIKK